MTRWGRYALVTAAAVTIGLGTGTAVAVTTSHTAVPAMMPGPATLAGIAASPTTSPEMVYVPIAPCRVVDTRGGAGPLVNNVTRSFYVSGTFGFAPQGGVSGGCGVPADAVSVTATVGAINAHGGFLRIWPYGTPEPGGATVLSYPANASLAAGSTLTLTPNAGKAIYARNYGGSAQLTISVTGYYVPQIEGYIGGDGSLQTGTSRITSVQHAGTGAYYVTVDRNVRSCSITATAYNLYRYASVGYSSSTTPNVISVYVWYMNGSTPTPVDYPFHVHVSC